MDLSSNIITAPQNQIEVAAIGIANTKLDE